MKAFGSFLLALVFFTTEQSVAQALASPNQVSVSVAATAAYNDNTGLFTYDYVVTNFSDALLEVSQLHLRLSGASVLNFKSPPGWEASVNADGAMMSWCACSEDGIEIPPDYIDDGRGLPSKFQIKPGQTLSGFSLQSAYPPGPGTFYAGGWVPIPVEGVDFPVGAEPASQNFPENMFSGSVSAAPTVSNVLEFGGRRSAVDGFLVFTSIEDGGAYSSPLFLVDITFGQFDESVDTSTFAAQLNDVDVTAQFIALDQKHRRARFNVGTVLKLGKNVLKTSVKGTVPGATRTAEDTDRITFLVQ